MRILFVSSGNTKWGISPFVRRQGESLARSGCNVDYFGIKKGGLRGYIIESFRLKTHLKNNSYDIVHVHYSLSGLVLLLSGYRGNKVLSLMGDDAYGSYNDKGKRRLSSWIEMAFTQMIQLYFPKIISKSDEISNYVWRKKSFVVPNGVNNEKFKVINRRESRKLLGLPQEKFIVMFLGNKMNGRKNYKLFTSAIQECSRLDIYEHSPYPLNPSEVPLHLNAADVLIHTSIKEGSPNLVKEAMFCGCGVISTNVGDVRKLFNGQEGCRLVTFSSREISKVIDNWHTKEWDRSRSLSWLTEESIAKELLKIY